MAEATKATGHDDAAGTLFLKEKATDWLAKYKAGSLKQKRVDIFAGMKGFA